MTTAQLAIVVTGAVGLGAPIVSQFFESKREKRRFDHERDLRDRDSLRVRLDAVAEAIDTAWRTTSAAEGILATQGPDGADLPKRVVDAFQAIHDANLANAKLGLWIARDEGTGKAATECIGALDYIVCAIDVQKALQRYTDNFSYGDLNEHRQVAQDASRRYVAGALDEYGMRRK